jgi:exo-beta-1,3-glucanase (GH17 family)
MNEFRTYVRYMTQRYKGKVRYWEVGNEVDWIFWKDSLADYARYLNAAAGIIRKADPQNRIILASLAFDGTHVWNPQEGAEEDALRRLYELGIKPDFDVLGAHYYPLESSDSLHEAVSAVNQIGSVMAEFGDEAKPVWLTESGYSSSLNPDGGLSRQAEYLKRLYTEIIAHPKIEKIFWYNWRCKSGEGDYEDNFGVVNNDFSERPAFRVLRDLEKHTVKPANCTMFPSGVK